MNIPKVTIVYRRDDVTRDPRIAMALHDGNVRWLLSSEYHESPSLTKVELEAEMIGASKQVWHKRISDARGESYAADLIGSLQ